MIFKPSLLLWKKLMNLKLFSQLLLVLCIFVLASCASTTHQTGHTSLTTKDIPTHAKNTKQAHILLVNTNQKIDRYKVAENSFISAMDNNNIHTVDLSQDSQPVETLQDLLNTNHFDAIYCIGAKALGSIDYIDPDMPVVFSSVLNWRRFESQNNYSGIASEIAPKAQLTWFKYFFPQIKNIGVLHSLDNQQLLNDAALAVDKLNLKLITQEISSETQFDNKARDLFSQIDALWLISDPSVLASTGQTNRLFEMAHKANVPIFTYHSFFMDLGATLSITADLPTTGIQAAFMMKKILQQPDYKHAAEFPAGSSIILNIQKTEAYKLILNEGALDSVDELIEH